MPFYGRGTTEQEIRRLSGRCFSCGIFRRNARENSDRCPEAPEQSRGFEAERHRLCEGTGNIRDCIWRIQNHSNGKRNRFSAKNNESRPALPFFRPSNKIYTAVRAVPSGFAEDPPYSGMLPRQGKRSVPQSCSDCSLDKDFWNRCL